MFAGRSGSVRSLQLAGSTVLITGASGGLGGAIARALHARGARVLLNGRRAEALEGLAAELGERAEVLALDLAESGAALELAERAGDVDALVANAALPASGSVEDFTHEQIDRAIDVNLRAPIQLTRALLPGMLERGRGHLLYVSSLSGKVASIRSCIYSATKFGLRGFASGVREDLHGTDVGVTVVFPSFIGDVGMYAETGVTLPRGVALISAEQVASAVVRGIEEGRDEIDVAPLSLRAGVVVSSLAPRMTARLQRRLGSDRIAAEMAEAQRDKR
jgi:short-subunit dehydrogenase